MHSTPSQPEEHSTGLPIPGLKTWRGVYIFVTVLLIGYVLVMTILKEVYTP